METWDIKQETVVVMCRKCTTPQTAILEKRVVMGQHEVKIVVFLVVEHVIWTYKNKAL